MTSVTLTEALEVTRRMTPGRARHESTDTSDPMLRSVCSWRAGEATRDQFDLLLKLAHLGPAILTLGEVNQAVLAALRDRPLTSEELRVHCEITQNQLSVAILRLRKDGYDINLVSTGRHLPRRFQLDEPE